MENLSEKKITRRDALVSTGKIAAALGAAALIGRVRPVRADKEGEELDDDDVKQPSGGVATAAKMYTGNDPTLTPLSPSHLVPVGLVPIEFTIALDPSDLLYPTLNQGGINGITVIAIADSVQVYVSANSAGGIAIYKNSNAITSFGVFTWGPIVSGTSIDVAALQSAVRSFPLGITTFTINQNGRKYRLLAFGSPSVSLQPDNDFDGD